VGSIERESVGLRREAEPGFGSPDALRLTPYERKSDG